jgi:hypothetical protein
MSYVRDERDLEACPACGSGRLSCVVGTRLDMCVTCLKCWERLPAGEPYTVDGEMLSFKLPCDTCAYRGNSDERLDPEAWNVLQLQLAHGGKFYCHKGVPFDAAKAAANQAQPFEYPRKEAGVRAEGKVYVYQQYDLEHMRLCRGYLNMHILKRMRASLADIDR